MARFFLSKLKDGNFPMKTFYYYLESIRQENFPIKVIGNPWVLIQVSSFCTRSNLWKDEFKLI